MNTRFLNHNRALQAQMNSMLTNSATMAPPRTPIPVKFSNASTHALPSQRRNSALSGAATTSPASSNCRISPADSAAHTIHHIGRAMPAVPKSATFASPMSSTGPHNSNAAQAGSLAKAWQVSSSGDHPVSRMTGASDPASGTKLSPGSSPSTRDSTRDTKLPGAAQMRESGSADGINGEPDAKRRSSMASPAVAHASQGLAHHGTSSHCRDSMCGSPNVLEHASADKRSATPDVWSAPDDAAVSPSDHSAESWKSSRSGQVADLGNTSDGGLDVIEAVQADEMSAAAPLYPEAQSARYSGLPHVLELDAARLRASAAFDTLLSMSTASEQGAPHLAESEGGALSSSAGVGSSATKSNPYMQRLRWPPTSAAVQDRSWLHSALESASVSSSGMQARAKASAPSNVLQTSMAQSWGSMQAARGKRNLGGLAFGADDGEPLQENISPVQTFPFEPLPKNVPEQTFPLASKGETSALFRT